MEARTANGAKQNVVADSETPRTLNIDRNFLEYIWKCITQSSELSLGQHGQYRKLTLADAEASHEPRRSFSANGDKSFASLDPGDVESRRGSNTFINRSNREVFARRTQNSKFAITTDQGIPEQSHVPATSLGDDGVINFENDETDHDATTLEAIKKADRLVAKHAIRLFASEARMWHALTGHGPDHSRVKELDLILLSIISTYGSKGILQNDLVRISGQDKRSLPSRTDRLHECGYIEKEKIITITWEGTKSRKLPTSICVLKRYAEDPQHKRELKRLNEEALAKPTKRKGRKWAKRKSSQNHESHATDPPIDIEATHITPTLEDEVAASFGNMVVPQWTPDRSMVNQIYDIVERSGIKGVTIPELRDALLGEEHKKPVESSINRIVEAWQVSQPLHLRHLAIVRDTVLRGKSPIYIHYTYGHFKKLVDGGKASWKAVTTIVTADSEEVSNAASLDSQPNLDEYGFPVLDAKEFQGRAHDATLADCAAVAAAASPRDNESPTPRRRRLQMTEHDSLSNEPQELSDEDRLRSKRPTIVKKGVGRPRKYANTISSVDLMKLPISELKRIHQSEVHAARYQKSKIIAEIERRSERGEDSQMVAKEVLQDTDDLIKLGDMECLYQHVREEILHNYGGGPPAQASELEIALSKRLSVRTSNPKKRGRRKQQPYYPSIAAHSQFVPTGLAIHLRRWRAEHRVESTGILDNRTRKRKINLPEELLDINKKKPRGKRIIEQVSSWPGETNLGDTSSRLPDHETSLAEITPRTSVHGIATIAAPYRERNISEMITKRYSEQSDRIHRPHDGFFYGETLDLRRRKAESQVEIPITYKIAIFKLIQLQSLDWFVPTQYIFEFGFPMTSPIKPMAVTLHNHDKHRSKPQDTESPSAPCSPPPEPSAPLSRELQSPHDKVGPFDLPLDASATVPSTVQPLSPPQSMRLSPLVAPQSEPLYESPYANEASETRKRKRTPHLEVDEEPVSSWSSNSFDAPPLLKPRLGAFTVRRRGRPPKGVKRPEHRPSPQQDITEASRVIDIRINGHCETISQNPIATLPFEGDPFYVGANVNVHENGVNKVYNSSRRAEIQKGRNLGSPEAVAKQSKWVKLTVDKVHLQSILLGDEVQEMPTPEGYAQPNDESESLEAEVEKQEPLSSLWLSLKIGSAGLQGILQQSLVDQNVPVGSNALLAAGQGQDQELDPSSFTLSNKRQSPKRVRKIKNMSIVGINRRGGSMAILREDIILELVDRCGGASPGYTELAVPFAVEWAKHGQSGQPERNTVRNAVNNLCKARRLRQLTFAFQTREGLTKTSSILTLPEVDPRAPKVQYIQDQISRNSPRTYLPKEWLIEDEVQIADDGSAGKASIGSVAPLRKAEAHQRLDWHKQLLQKGKKAEEEKALKLQAIMERDRRRAAKAAYRYEASRKALADKLAEKRSIQRLDSLGLPATSSQSAYSGLKRKPGPKPLQPTTRTGTFGDFSFQNSSTTTWQIVKSPARLYRRSPTARKKSLLRPHRPLYSLSGPSITYPNFKFNIVPQRAGPQYDSLQQKSRVSWLGANPTALDMSMTTDDESIFDTSESSQSDSPHMLFSPSITPVPQRPTIAKKATKYLKKRRTAVQPSYMDPQQSFHAASGTFSTSFDGAPTSTVKPTRFTRKYTRRSTVAGNGEAPQNTQSRVTKSHFELEVEKVRKAELQLPNLQNLLFPHWTFINHHFPHPHKGVPLGIVLIDSGKMYVANKTGRIDAKAMALFLEGETQDVAGVFDQGARLLPRKYYPSTDKSQVEKIQRRKRKRRRVAPNLQLLDHGEFGDDEEGLQHSNGPRPAKLRRFKGPLDFRTLTDEEEQRLVTAVVAIRCLTGGLEKRIDWPLIAIVFEPDRDEEYIHARWNHTRERYKTVLDRVEANFQEIFITAYEEGLVPPIDFDNLESYPWKWLIQWITENSKVPSYTVPDLPSSRDTLVDEYTMIHMTEDDINQFYEMDGPVTSHARKYTINRHAWTFSLHNTSLPLRTDEDPDLCIAKTWVRANVATPHETYDPDIARATLLTFSERTIELALRDLLADKLLTQERKGRLLPGRNYFFNEQMFARLQKNIPASTFRRAANFKAQLDSELALNGMAEYFPHAQDGDVVVTLNLLASGRITLRPKDIPKNRFGYTDGGYKTRQMDKSRLYCNVVIYPRPTYVPGNPLFPLPLPPARHLSPPPQRQSEAINKKQKIPLWYDIHNEIIPPLWDIVLAAVMTILITRPGIGVKEVEKTMKPCMEAWEIEWVLDWMVEAGVATARGEGEKRRWVSGEWWWLILGGDESDKMDVEEMRGVEEVVDMEE